MMSGNAPTLKIQGNITAIFGGDSFPSILHGFYAVPI